MTNQQFGKSRAGNPQIVFSFLIVGEVDQADPEGDLLSCSQYERSIFRTITEKTIEYVLEDLAALGFTGTSYQQLSLDHPQCVDLRGTEIALFCNHEEDNREEHAGEIRERWSIARASSGPKVDTLDNSDARKLDAMFGKQLKSQSKAIIDRKKVEESEAPAEQPAAPLTPEAVATEAAANENKDDIPF
jgi:hypothetical protein